MVEVARILIFIGERIAGKFFSVKKKLFRVGFLFLRTDVHKLR